MAGHLHYGGNVIPDTLQPIPVTRHHAAKRCYLRCKTTKLGGTSTISVFQCSEPMIPAVRHVREEVDMLLVHGFVSVS